MKTRKGKPGYRKKTRELLVRLLFQMASTGDFSDEAKEGFLDDKSLYAGGADGDIFDEASSEEPDMSYLNWAFVCVRDHIDEIDEALNKASEKWSLSRMSGVDLAILRVAAGEILYIEEIEDNISVNEAVLLAKKYGSEKSAGFINGILGAVTRSSDEAVQ